MSLGLTVVLMSSVFEPPLMEITMAMMPITAATMPAPTTMRMVWFFRLTWAAISPADIGRSFPGLRPGMRTVCAQEGQVTSCPAVEPGMKKFQPQLQLRAILAMDDLPSRSGFP